MSLIYKEPPQQINKKTPKPQGLIKIKALQFNPQNYEIKKKSIVNLGLGKYDQLKGMGISTNFFKNAFWNWI